MDRRNFLLGLGSASIGGAALVGSGAFSRVESHRDVSIQVATDENAYLGLKPLDTPNSNNYVELDENGHLTINIAEHNDFDGPDTRPGEGVNSDSFTWFDGMFDLCNQGKEGACLSYALPSGVVENDVDEQTVAFYYVERDSAGAVTNRRIVDENEEILLELGECAEMGVRTVTKGVDSDNTPLIDGEATVTADVDGDCFGSDSPTPSCSDCTAPDPGTDDFTLTVENVDDSSFPTIQTTVRVETTAGGDGDLTESNFDVCEQTVGEFGGDFCGQDIENVQFGSEDVETEADVMLVLDTSGSMLGQKLDNARQGAYTLIGGDEDPGNDPDQGGLDPTVNAGLVTFGGSASLEQGLTTDHDLVETAVDNTSAFGGTPMADAINEAQAELDANGDPNTADFIVLLANGNADDNSATRQAARDARNVTDLNNDGDGTSIISIAYGFGADQNLMEDLSGPPKVDDDTIDDDDANAFVGEQDDISQVFKDIGEIIAGTYTIDYETANFATDGNDRNVRVYVDDPNEGDADDTGSYTAPSS